MYVRCETTDKGIMVDEIRDFDLAQTLDCGQSFRLGRNKQTVRLRGLRLANVLR